MKKIKISKTIFAIRLPLQKTLQSALQNSNCRLQEILIKVLEV
jgi:hypothetical protein